MADFFADNQWLFVSLHVVFVVLVALSILLTKQENVQSALMWMITIFALPVLGIFLYVLFGVNQDYIRFDFAGRKARRINESFYSKVGHLLKRRLSFLLSPFEENARNPRLTTALNMLFPRSMPVTGNAIALLHDGSDAYPQMLEAIANAKKSIHLQCYLIMDDLVGTQFFDEMLHKAKQGVEVCVLYDSIGSWHGTFKFLRMRYRNRHVKKMHIKAFSVFTFLTPWRLQYRNHKKALIVDGAVAFVGGLNISSDNVRHSHLADAHIHDLHARIQGPSVNEIQFSFLRDWVTANRHVKMNQFLNADYFPDMESCGNALIRTIASGPGQNPQAIDKVFMACASTAEHKLWIMTPYFVVGNAFRSALKMAVARGVDVRLVVPACNNHKYVYYAMCAQYDELLAGGVRIYERRGSFQHTKSMLVDESIMVIGSPNCDERSFKLNFELALIVNDQASLFATYQMFVHAFEESDAVTPLSRGGGIEYAGTRKKFALFRRRLLESVCNMLSPIL